MNKGTALIIDDEAQMRKLLEITLESNDYKVLQAATAREGLVLASTHPPQFILLDLGLPDMDGHEVLRSLREWYTAPVFILSVQSSEDDIVSALDHGASDYLVKPFRTGELLARIRSAMRGVITEKTPVLQFDELQIDLAAHSVKKGTEIIRLTVTEYNLFALLAKNEGKVLTHHYLLKEIWGPGYINQSQYLRVFIAQLRKKIEDDPNRPERLITESGIGYRFVSKD
jgi:two-component system KDP operon response regulator KdpE